MADCCWFVETEQQLAAALSELPRFQSFCGVADSAAALARIHFETVPRNEETELMTPLWLKTMRPWAVIWSENPGLARVADFNSLKFSGQVGMLLEINNADIEVRDPTATDTNKKVQWFKIELGKMIVELFEAWAGLDRTLQIAWSFSHPIKGQDVDHATAFVSLLWGFDTE